MHTAANRKPLFDTIRAIANRGLTQPEVDRLDGAIDRLLGKPVSQHSAPPSPYRVSESGIALIKRFEGCARMRDDGLVEAYPDPGSADGLPWTIGWGATGAGIDADTVWTKAECDSRLEQDIKRYASEVAEVLGDAPTSQSQFDALVSFHYNTGAIARATLTKLHIRGDHEAAAREFTRWIYNDGQKLAGLQRRRAAEAQLYEGEAGQT